MLHVSKRSPFASAMEQSAGYIITPSYIAMTIGTALIISAYTHTKFGKGWPTVSVALIAVLHAIGLAVAIGARQ